jgi:ankyrin repeat protein
MRLTYSGDEAVPIVEYLIAHGANVAAKDKDGNTVFSHAKAEASAPRLLEVLEQASQAQQTNSSK